MSKYYNNYKKETAFTLAEILITLGIIGIVAAITIPTLISKYRKYIAETRLKVFYSTFNQGIKLAEADFGDKMQWDVFKDGTAEDGELNSYKWFMKYLAPYIKTVKITKTNEGQTALYLPNGSAVQFAAGLIEFYPEAETFNKCKFSKTKTCRNAVDNFAFMYAPTKVGYIGHYKQGVEPYTWNWNGEKSDLYTGHGYSSTYGCNKDSTIAFYCTKLIQMNGWKIPDDYPFKF